MHQTFRHFVCVVLLMHGHWMRMTLLCMFFHIMPIWKCMCMSICANAVRHLLYTRYSKFSKIQSEDIYLCHNLSELEYFLIPMLRMALEHEINVLVESYCINVLSIHSTSRSLLDRKAVHTSS